MNAKNFRLKTGRAPEQDDLQRVNCLQAGEVGHNDCGWCSICDHPKFECICPAKGKVVFMPAKDKRLVLTPEAAAIIAALPKGTATAWINAAIIEKGNQTPKIEITIGGVVYVATPKESK